MRRVEQATPLVREAERGPHWIERHAATPYVSALPLMLRL
jgi:hypothetical protein